MQVKKKSIALKGTQDDFSTKDSTNEDEMSLPLSLESKQNDEKEVQQEGILQAMFQKR